MEDRFKKIRVQVVKKDWEKERMGKVRIHYDHGPCWFVLTKDEARELAQKIDSAVELGMEFPLDEEHMTDF
jgi:hypothetical protein